MKLRIAESRLKTCESPPARGARIETRVKVLVVPPTAVAPREGGAD